MTITSTTNRVNTDGDGATTVFSFPYYVEDSGDLEVWLRSSAGVETLQTLTTHYSLSGLESAAVSVTMVTAPANGERLTCIRKEPHTNEISVDDVNSFRAQAFEDQFDRIARGQQRIEDEVGRSIRLRDTDLEDATGEYDANSRQIVNVADGVEDNDAANVAQITSLTSASVVAAATSASNAATSESNAATSESNASTSESNAATSESNAATSASNAATSASNASTSESNAATSESNAAQSAVDAGMDWQGAWVTSTAYTVSQVSYNAGYGAYICTSGHTSGASTEPGVGASWATVWDLVAADGVGGAAATESVPGISKIATQVKTDTGTDDSSFITPLKLENSAINAAVAANTAKVTNATHTGDVTGSGVLTIAANAVSLVKMAQITTARFLGRVTAATGNVETLTAAQMKTALGYITDTWTALIDGGDNTLKKINLLDYGEVTNTIGSIGGGTQDIDLENGNFVVATVDTSTTTFTFSNPTASDKGCSFTLVLTNGGSQAVNWPASVDWAGGTAPPLTTSGVCVLEFFTVDGGTIWNGFLAGLDMS
ncbi:MAG: hypothetical protein GY749_22715 [Desulfobacteraceae bacterium]|nr:hypothetical protein [Desulfobacteraceae bacterium]